MWCTFCMIILNQQICILQNILVLLAKRSESSVTVLPFVMQMDLSTWLGNWNSRIHNKFTNTRIIQIFCTNDKIRLLERACNSVFKFKEFSFYISGSTGKPFSGINFPPILKRVVAANVQSKTIWCVIQRRRISTPIHTLYPPSICIEFSSYNNIF